MSLISTSGMFNSPEKSRINKDEIWDRWVGGIEAVMAEDKLRAMDVFRRFDADRTSMIGRFEFTEGVMQAGIDLNTPAKFVTAEMPPGGRTLRLAYVITPGNGQCR